MIRSNVRRPVNTDGSYARRWKGRRRGWPMDAIFLALAGVLLTASSTADAAEAAPALDLSSSLRYQCWETHGVFERDCFHDETLTLDPYPLTPEMFPRAIRYSTSDLTLHRAFRRARGRGVLKVVVLGGSVTFGHECSSPAGLEGIACAWPHRVEQWFQEENEDLDIEVTNASIPGFGVMQFLLKRLDKTLPVDLEVDLIIVDFGVNDAVIELFEYNLEHLKMAHELLIRYIRYTMFHSPALLYAESFIAPSRTLQVPWQSENMAEAHASVTRKHDIPMVSFRDAVWPQKEDYAAAEVIWGHSVHPDWQVHQLMADVVAYYLQLSYARFLEVYGPSSNPSPSERELQRFKSGMGCLANPRSAILQLDKYLDAPPPEELVSVSGSSVSGDAGPTGFRKDATDPAVATFDLVCDGGVGLLDMEYLVSYEGMGSAMVEIEAGPTAEDVQDEGNSSTSTVIVDGLWDSHASVPSFETIPIPDAGGGRHVRVSIRIMSAEGERSSSSSRLFDFKGDLDREKEVRGDRKFKLISLQCC
ncbi:unnamed protein product [Ectocarpus sp. CCAP 1310/34]|nr:unnamed protein product [Ectocarpus sp. CCAP 1310/34]